MNDSPTINRIETTSLSGKVAVVTGGTSGIGRATAVALAREGARVAVIGRSAQRMNETLQLADSESARSRMIGLRLDVCSPDDMQRMVEEVMEEFGRIDILVAAAGVGGPTAEKDAMPKMVLQLSVREWDEVINTNLRGVFLSNRAVLPTMLRQRSGNIINISSSRGATMGLPFAAAYSASKHAAIGLTESLAEEVSSSGIRVQAILPDVTNTPLMTDAEHLCPEGLLSPEQVAAAIVMMLTSPDDVCLRYPIIAPRRSNLNPSMVTS